MAHYSKDEFKILSKTDLFSFMSKSLSLTNDYSPADEKNDSAKFLTNTYFDNSKQLTNSIPNHLKQNSLINYYKNLPDAIPISINQILKTQNTNAPWLFNVLKNKFHRSRKHKKTRVLSKDIKSNNVITDRSILLAETFLDKPITTDQTSGKWIVTEKQLHCPVIEVCKTS